MFRKTNSLLTRITALLTLVILLSMIIFGFFSYRSEIRLAEESLKTQASIYLQSTADSISSHAAQVELIARQTAFDTRVLSVLESRSIGVYMITLLFRTTDYLNEAEMFLSLLDADLVLLVRDDDVPESYMTAVHLSRLQEDSAFQDFLNSDRLTGWMYTASSPSFMRHSASSLDTLDFYQKVSDGMRPDLGVIRVSVPVRRLFASFDQLPFRGSLDFLYGDTPLLSVSSDAPSGASLLLVQEIPSMNLVLKLHVDLQQAHAAALMRTWTTLAFLLGFGLLLLLICVLALRRILSRVTRMTEAVSKIPEQGRFAVALPEPGEDEAGKLSVAFSDLLNRLEGNYEELLRKEKDKRHALQLALQYQMNPHFLFNSLYWLQLQLEEHSGDLVLSDAVAQLGVVLHYNIAGKIMARVSEERELILAYAAFMQAMIGSRMEVDFMAPSEIADFRILRFSLQPIVENAIRHGHIKDQPLHIAVRFTVVSEEQCLLITLTNDGRPIDPSQAERLNELMRHPPDTLGTDMQGIGLVNLVVMAIIVTQGWYFGA